ncbi:hypothetical protein BJ508DRAFT_305858 [Ascobolus immersus RN42]|uniref:F-box domain-containing protein n=1 Tax=Ascobolus immersus RN42 TaxID=1160509 RepID=A0A3N4I7Z6_ASCIM|nr:hypothetical protein BJ508DRAFT_305858 [Ascobolus immersus RN42]
MPPKQKRTSNRRVVKTVKPLKDDSSIKPFPLLFLPNELIHLIITFLHDVPTYLKFMQTSRRIKLLARTRPTCNSFLTQQYLLHDTGPQYRYQPQTHPDSTIQPTKPLPPTPSTSVFGTITDQLLTTLYPPFGDANHLLRTSVHTATADTGTFFRLSITHAFAYSPTRPTPVAKFLIPINWVRSLQRIITHLANTTNPYLNSLARVWLVQGMAEAFSRRLSRTVYYVHEVEMKSDKALALFYDVTKRSLVKVELGTVCRRMYY